MVTSAPLNMAWHADQWGCRPSRPCTSAPAHVSLLLALFPCLADVDGMVNLFTPDGIYAVHGAPTMRGHDQIRKGVSAFIGAMQGKGEIKTHADMTVKVDPVDRNPHLLVAYGEQTIIVGDGEPSVALAFCVAVKVDGQWKLQAVAIVQGAANLQAAVDAAGQALK